MAEILEPEIGPSFPVVTSADSESRNSQLEKPDWAELSRLNPRGVWSGAAYSKWPEGISRFDPGDAWCSCEHAIENHIPSGECLGYETGKPFGTLCPCKQWRGNERELGPTGGIDANRRKGAGRREELNGDGEETT